MSVRARNTLRGWLTLAGLACVAVALWHQVAAWNGYQGLAPLGALERYAYDVRLRLSAPTGLDPRVVIVDIDEQSLREEGQWPWSRAKLATLLDRLFDDYEVDTVVFDVVFAEAEDRYGRSEVEAAAARAAKGAPLLPVLETLGGDARFASAIHGRSVVLGYFFEQNDVESVGVLPPAMGFTEGAALSHAPTMRRYSANLPVLQQASGEAGFFSLSAVTDPDGVVRRVALLNEYEGALYPALSLAAVQRFSGVPPSPVIAQTRAEGYPSLEALDLGIGRVPLDAQAAVFVPYRKAGAYASFSATEVLQRQLGAPETLAGTIALIGTSAAGLNDARNTPLANGFPGVEIHATLISALLDSSFRQQPAWTIGFNLVLTTVLGTLLAWRLPRSSIAVSTTLTVVLLAGLLGSNAWFWQAMRWVVPIAVPLSLVLVVYWLNTVVGFFAESRSRQIMRRMFGLYVPPEIVDEMSASPDIYSLRGERRQMSVLFSDVRNFTRISEALSPESLSELLNTLLTPITAIIHRHHGAIDKYMGDAVMAFWGAPIASSVHAASAVTAALEIVAGLKQLNKDFAEKGWPQMEMGIGISTGTMSVGNMGSEFRMAYTVLGDRVNLGARLEGLTKRYGVEIIVSEATREAAPDFVYQELDWVRVKGKQQPERIFTPMCHTGDATRSLLDELTQHETALAAYRQQRWDTAETLFSQLDADFNRLLYAVYVQRVRAYRKNPPAEDWDGVAVMDEK